MLIMVLNNAWCCRWVCCKCNASYSSCPELTYHGMEQHEAHYEDLSRCALCHLSLNEHSYQEEVVYMDDSESNQHQYVCDLCNVVFNNKRNLTTHILTHSEIYLKTAKNDECEPIDMEFLGTEDLANHIIAIKEEKVNTGLCSPSTPSFKFLCYVCERTFNCEVEYLSHMRNCGSEPFIVDELLSESEKKISFQCFYCDVNFTSEGSVQSHIFRDHSSGSGNEYRISSLGEIEIFNLRCQFCNVLFVNSLQRDAHLCGNDQKCKMCEEIFIELGSLWNHMFSVHHDKNLTCTLCPSLVLRETDLIEHLLVKHKTIVKIIPYEKQTSKSLKKMNSKELKENSRVIVDGKEKFVCRECPSMVNTFSSLTRHMAYAHCDDTPYQCNHCNKAFKTKNKLRIHQNSVHERTRSYDCHFCGRGFAISSNLTKHLRIHTGEKPYVCDECGMKFAQSSSLYSHKITHKQDACHVCSDCGKGFLRAYQLRNHRLQKHLGVLPPKSHVCETCGSGFRSNGLLRRHLQTHNPLRSFVCEQCDAAFTMRKYLVQHYKTHRLSHLN